MGTEHIVFKEEEDKKLYVYERGCNFSICFVDYTGGLNGNDLGISTKYLTREEIVDIAVAMIQPTLYNVADPDKFFKEVILEKINKLFV